MPECFSIWEPYCYSVMSDDTDTLSIGRSRALITERERELIAAKEYESQNYQAISRVRSRIEEELTTDVALLREDHPELLAELREVVCDG